MKSNQQKRNFRNKLLLSVLATSVFTSMFSVFPVVGVQQAYAQSASKTMTIKFDPNASQTQTKTITIPNLKSVDGVTVNTGNAEVVSVNGDQVTIRVSNGQYVSRDSYTDPQMYSKAVTVTKTNSVNSFATTVPYSDAEGYSASALAKSGSVNSRVVSGSLTAGDSKTVTDTRTSSYSGGTPSSLTYNSGGYTGTLYGGSESAYVVSGSYTPGQSMTVTSYQTFNASATSIGNSDLSGWRAGSSSYPSFSSTMSYNSGGFSGTLTRTSGAMGYYVSGEFNDLIGGYYPTRKPKYSGEVYTKTGVYRADYSGTVTSSGSDTRVWNYQRSYSGTVTKAPVDTRVWEYSQAYAGTAYKAGTAYNNYKYAYDVTLTYVDNQSPMASISKLSDRQTVKETPISVDLAGHFTDADGDVLTYTAELTKTDVATATINGTTLTVTPKKQGSTMVTVTANDGKGGTATKSFTLVVENRNPVLNVTSKDIVVGKDASVVIEGSVNDADLDQMTVSAVLGGVSKQMTVTNGTFNLTWMASELADGTYTDIEVKAVDTLNAQTVKPFTGTIQVDKIAPLPATFSADKTTPTNTDVQVTISYPSDASMKEFKLGASGDWKSYTQPIVLSSNNTVYARSKDNAGNLSAESNYVVNNIDKTAPVKATFVADKTAPTNSDVKVTITFAPDATVKEFKVGDGEWLNYTAPIVMTENNTIIARSKDQAGNDSGESSYIVNNIDKILPEKPVLSSLNTAITNQSVKVTVAFPQDAVAKKVRIGESGDWLDYVDAVVVENNATVYARAIDQAGNYSENTLVINNIDKIAPTAPKLITSGNKLAITAGTDLESGVEKTLLKINDQDWVVYQQEQELPDGNYHFQAKTVDIAGNESVIADIKVLFYANALKQATNAVVEAEKSPSQELVDVAKEAVQALPTVPEKPVLLDRVQIVQDGLIKDQIAKKVDSIEREVYEGGLTFEEIDKLKEELADLKDQLTALHKAIDKTELLNRIQHLSELLGIIKEILTELDKVGEADTDKLKDLIEKLPDSKLKDELQDRIDRENALQDAVQKVEEAEKSLDRGDLQDAKDTVSKLPDSSQKDDLLDRIDQVEKSIDALEAVEKAERTLEKTDFDRASNLVTTLSNDSLKGQLSKRLEAIRPAVEAIDAVKTAEKSKKQTDVNDARPIVNKLASGALKDSLHNRLDKVDVDYKDALSKVELAEKILNNDFVQRADDAIGKLIEANPHKQELVDRLNIVKQKLADQAYADQLANAKRKVEQAEQYKRNPYLADAWTLVNALPDNADKQALVDRLKAIQIDNGNGGGGYSPETDIDIGKLTDPAVKDLLMNVIKAVERAERHPLRVYIVDALEKVDAIPDRVRKDITTKKIVANLEARTQFLKKNFNDQIEEVIDAVALKKAQDYVALYEKHKLAYNKAKAQEAVNALPEGETRTQLQGRIDAVVPKK